MTSGLTRTICANFIEFKVKIDQQFDQFFLNLESNQAVNANNGSPIQQNKSKWERQLVHKDLRDVKFVSYNYLI